MIKFENTEVMGWEAAIRGMRNPMNSWNRSDSGKIYFNGTWYTNDPVIRSYFTDYGINFMIGSNDLGLMKRLADGGSVHAKYRRMITVYVDITAPLYWWKEFDTYKVGTVANSCSTMHKIHAKEFTLEDFSTDHLLGYSKKRLFDAIQDLNYYRDLYLNGGKLDFAEKYGDPTKVDPKDKRIWWQMIQLLPSSYNQKRTVQMNYEVLAHIYQDRKGHKLDEWAEHEPDWEFDVAEPWQFGLCDWIKSLPYSELITGEGR